MPVFVLDKRKKPLDPCSEKRARLLLSRGRAVVHKMYPFTIRLKDRLESDCVLSVYRLKLDPGSKTTGLAITKEEPIETEEDLRAEKVIFLAEIQHRGSVIKSNLESRRSMRRTRRNRKTRYRAARFNNRTKPKGWLAPSLQHRVDTTMSVVKKFCKLIPITHISQELVRFDMQQMRNPEISGVEYQQGTLFGYEVREYLLEKYERKCTYCGAENTPLEIEHIVPRSRGGSNSVTNLCLACRRCNVKKGNMSLEEFLVRNPELLAKIKRKAKIPLRDAAAVNSTRWALANKLKEIDSNLELSTGGRTKYNRRKLEIPKTHALDAACVGKVAIVTNWKIPTLNIKCVGRGRYSRTLMNKYGFPRAYLMASKYAKGFKSGDLVKAIVPANSKKSGTYVGKVAIRETGSFNISCNSNIIQGISYKHCRLLARADGYTYNYLPIAI